MKLEKPFGPDSTTGDLLARMEQDAFLARERVHLGRPGRGPPGPAAAGLGDDRVRASCTSDGGGWYRRPIGYWFEPPKSLIDPDEGFIVPAGEVRPLGADPGPGG